jgi:hypothetical protein
MAVDYEDFPALPGFYKLLFLYIEPSLPFALVPTMSVLMQHSFYHFALRNGLVCSWEFMVLVSINSLKGIPTFAVGWSNKNGGMAGTDYWITSSESTHKIDDSSGTVRNRSALFSILLTLFCAGYLLLGLISSLVFRSLRDSLRHDPFTQERILSAIFTALALADVRTSHITSAIWMLTPSSQVTQWVAECNKSHGL